MKKKPKVIEDLEPLMRRPDYQGYEKHVDGLDEARQRGDVPACLNSVRTFVTRHCHNDELREYFLDQLNDLDPGMDKGVYGDASG